MRILMLIVIGVALVSGCTTKPRTSKYPPPFNDGVDIAVNLGPEHFEDIDKLQNALTLEGIPCCPRAINLNAEQLVVERVNFDKAKSIVTRIIIQEKLTARVYKSANFRDSIGNAQMEVWEQGKKIREESYKIY